MARNSTMMRLGLSIPVASLVVFLAYWFGFHDNWEIDNFSRITDKCEAVDRAIEEGADTVAARRYDELVQFIGDRQFKHEFIAERVQSTQESYVPVKVRIEQSKREQDALEIAESLERKDLFSRAEKLEDQLVDKLILGDNESKEEFIRELEELEVEAQQRLRQMNRKPGQEGYPIEIRRQALIMTFIQQGYSREWAVDTANAMEAQGAIPDPPKR